jgi:hypothetical protein
MIQITEIRWIAEYRFCFRFCDASVGACDLLPLLVEATSDHPLRDLAHFKTVLLVDGVPTWPDGLKPAPDRLLQHVDTAIRWTLLLDDTDDAILIGKSGEPVPSSDLLDWLAANCRSAWRYRYDGAWNMYLASKMRARRKASNEVGRHASYDDGAWVEYLGDVRRRDCANGPEGGLNA